MNFIEIRDPNTNRLLFRFDPTRDLIEIKVKGQVTLIDLSQYRRPVTPQRAANQPVLNTN